MLIYDSALCEKCIIGEAEVYDHTCFLVTGWEWFVWLNLGLSAVESMLDRYGEMGLACWALASGLSVPCIP